MSACSTGTTTATAAAAPAPTTTTTTAAPTTTTTAAPTTTTLASPFPTTVDAANGTVEIQEAPNAIVSLSPTATEMLFAIGAGDQVVAVDDQSNYPDTAPVTDLTGFSPNVEAIVAYDPDLVVITFDPGDLVASLDSLGIPVLLEPAAASIDDVYDQIGQLGTATGHQEEALDLVEQMGSDIDQILLDATAATSDGENLTYYFELDPTYYSVTSSTFIGQLVGMLGLENIADPADTDGFGYPQLSAEYILDADPDLIFLADTKCCGQSPETVAERPGWDSLTAVTEGNVFALDDDVASRWGPRIVDFLSTIADAVRQVTHP
ncbi:MAG: ABC transporter substrate-binding protein [Gammaproteobacteria bacterium]|nr:ABC transporter substrate-binding protein [Gammaproteobacteria bacterium]